MGHPPSLVPGVEWVLLKEIISPLLDRFQILEILVMDFIVPGEFDPILFAGIPGLSVLFSSSAFRNVIHVFKQIGGIE